MGKIAEVIFNNGKLRMTYAWCLRAEQEIIELVKGCIEKSEPHLVVSLDRFHTKAIIRETKKAIIQNLSNLKEK